MYRSAFGSEECDWSPSGFLLYLHRPCLGGKSVGSKLCAESFLDESGIQHWSSSFVGRSQEGRSGKIGTPYEFYGCRSYSLRLHFCLLQLDPFGHLVTDCFGDWLDKGWDIRPTIAVTKAHIDLPECREAIAAGRLKPDGKILMPSGQSICSKAAIEPVWYLPEIARRFQTTESNLRQSIFRMTNGMYPELITRSDIKMFLPPIGGLTIYIWGDPDTIPDEDIELTCRVHDECNGSDVFGSDICTCRPYLTHAIEECIKTAQRGGCGIVIYYRKEGRSLGEVTKYLVYNTRKRQEGGDSADRYFSCTEQVAGVQDTRFQALMPDPLHFLGVTKIHNFISMSDMKYNAIISTGITIENRIEIPPEMVPEDAKVEITAKVFHGYNAGKAYQGINEDELKKTKGRDYAYDKKK